MVASDTVVGAVGAVVLVIALIGVFVLESGPASVERNFSETQARAKASGTVARAGVNPQGGQCLPEPVTAACNPGATSINGFRIEGLPEVKEPASLMAWLKRADGQDRVQRLTYSNGVYTLPSHTSAGTTDYNELLVTYEATTNPTAPSDLRVYSKTFNVGARQSADLASEANVDFMEGAASVTIMDAGGQVAVSVRLRDAANRTGFTYTVWAVPNTGAPLNLGMFSGAQGTVHGEAKGGVNDYQRFVITLEPTNGVRETMEGWPVLETTLVDPIDPGPK